MSFSYFLMFTFQLVFQVYVLLKGSFSSDGIDELLRSIAVGRGRTEKLTEGLPTLSDVEPWNGKDGELPAEEEYDLSDVELDDIDAEKKDEL